MTLIQDPKFLFKAAIRGTSGLSVLALLLLAQSSGHVGLSIALALVWSLSIIVDTGFAGQRARTTPGQGGQAREGDADALNLHALVVKTDGRGNITFVNDRFLDLTGFDRTDLIGRRPECFGHAEDAALRAEIAEAHAAGNIWTGELRVTGKTGQVFMTAVTSIPRLDDARNLTGTISVYTDITAQTAALQARNAAKSLDLLSEPVFMVSADTHEVVFANDAALALFDWDRVTLGSVRMSEVNLDCDRRAILDRLADLKTGKIDHITFDASYKDTPFQGEVQLIEGADIGKRLYIVLRDQADVKAVARAKDELIATVSHELRTPLTSIKGALGLIRSGTAGELTDKIVSLLDIAYRNADRLVLIVNDILDLEKLAAGQMDYQMETQDILKTIRESIASNESFAMRFGVTISLKADPTPAWVVYDADRIHQVMTNLISNACKFSPVGSNIEVSVLNLGQTYHIRVSDEGAGIPASALERIFDRFTQVGKTDRARKGGTGLGLSIVKGIVESHGGTVALTSVEGEGTTVTVAFKRAPAPEITAPEMEAPDMTVTERVAPTLVAHQGGR